MPTEQITVTEKENIVKSDDKKKVRSFGNKAFDWAVWSSLYLSIWAFSLAFANKAQNGSGTLNKWFRLAQDKLEPKLKGFANSKVSSKLWGSSEKEWAGAAVLFAALSLGGTFFLPIIKYFEDRRQKIAAKIERIFGKNSDNPDNFKKEPKQTWGSIVKGRIAVIFIAFTTFVVAGPQRIGNLQDVVGGWATDAYIKTVKNANKDDVRKWANVAVFDILLTAIGAGVHYAISRVIAIRKTEKAEVALANAIIAENTGAVNKDEVIAEAGQKNRDLKETIPESSSGNDKNPKSWVIDKNVTHKETAYTLQ